MELESLELANREFEERLKSLEKEVSKKKTPSLHSIHSEDLFCLSRIRQLGEEEVNLKHNIRELEERETLFQEQINRILTSREFQKSMRESQCTGRKIIACPKSAQANNSQQMTKTLTSMGEEVGESRESNDLQDEFNPHVGTIIPDDTEEKKVECATKTSRQSNCKSNGGAEESSRSCSGPTPALIACYDKSSCPAASRISSKYFQSPGKSRHLSMAQTSKCPKHHKLLPTSGCTPRTCSSITTKSQASKGHCHSCCKKSMNLGKSPTRHHSTSVQSKNCNVKSSQRISELSKCPVGDTCKKCQGLILRPREQVQTRESSRCRCSCKGKCAKGKSSVPCNCAEYLDSPDDPGYQPLHDSTRKNDESSTDEEYAECCDCDSDDNDDSDSCKC